MSKIVKVEKARPTQARLLELLAYDAKTGDLVWKKRSEDSFTCVRAARSWNSRYAGKPALAHIYCGYKSGDVEGRKTRQHRAIWCMVYGYWPEEVDHINGIGWDNRLCNLRDVNHQENAKNQRMRKTNTSGKMGVSWHSALKRWQANIRMHGRQVHLGYYRERERAISARESAEKKYHYHPGHGKAL